MIASVKVKRTGNAASKQVETLGNVVEQFRFSGHETFACRFAWLPKAYQLLKRNPEAWFDDDQSMVEMGIGKNMVRSVRFWALAMQLVSGRPGKDLAVTSFGERIFKEGGLDPYIEHPATPWLLHWKLSSNPNVPLFAWNFMFNRWPYPEFSRHDVLRMFERDSIRLGHDHSATTLSQHLDAFLHTYLPSRNAVNIEDSLDGPLTDLGLLQIVGERRGDGPRREPIYSFRRGRKPEISAALFNFVVDDFWKTRRAGEATISLRELSVGTCSPGRILLLNEDDIRLRLEEVRKVDRDFEYLPSAIDGRIVRPHKASKKEPDLLPLVYRAEQ
jgi:hypothetical protein